MKNLVGMPERSGNPVLGDKTFDGLATTGDAMTLDGTVNRSFALVLILMAAVRPFLQRVKSEDFRYTEHNV